MAPLILNINLKFWTAPLNDIEHLIIDRYLFNYIFICISLAIARNSYIHDPAKLNLKLYN